MNEKYIFSNYEMMKYFKVGDKILVKSEPFSWSSGMNNYVCPLNEVLTFPHILEIKHIEYISNSGSINHVFVTDGKYGWDLGSIVNESDCYDNRKILRKIKLRKLDDSISII